MKHAAPSPYPVSDPSLKSLPFTPSSRNIEQDDAESDSSSPLLLTPVRRSARLNRQATPILSLEERKTIAQRQANQTREYKPRARGKAPRRSALAGRRIQMLTNPHLDLPQPDEATGQ